MDTQLNKRSIVGVNGTSLYCEDTGQGVPILFSHGLMWNTAMFSAQIEALQTHYRCLAYDHRGQGRSAEDLCDEITVETLASDAAALIENLGTGPVHFFGHSLGGFVGLTLALRRPDLLRSIVLCSTAAHSERAIHLPKYRLLSMVARYFGPAVVAGALMPVMHGPSFLRDASRQAQHAASRETLANNRRSVWRAANGVLNRPDLVQDLPKISVPSLILSGDEDQVRTISEAQVMAQAIPNATLVRIPHGGHMLPIEEPEAVTTAILDFLRTAELSR